MWESFWTLQAPPVANHQGHLVTAFVSLSLIFLAFLLPLLWLRSTLFPSSVPPTWSSCNKAQPNTVFSRWLLLWAIIPVLCYQAMGPAQPLVGTTVGPAHNQPSLKQQPDVVQSLSRVQLCDLMDCSTRLPCPSPSPGTCSNSCLLSWWCHPTISSSVVPFSSCPQSFPASGSFLISWLFTSGGQSIGVSASASFFPMNIQGWFP